ncbi:hypothetical protein [Psychromonas arctica]|uniref:hypothetical protein n=1 Tax=Psychromonas arctica TaxID=168275 RepID=UPI00041ED11E|nr:hypothetical protein [Psychromonas arctica]
MEGIFCGYYDQEMEQDVPLQPTLDEALTFFRHFHWQNQQQTSSMKILIFQIPESDEASLHISSLETGKWMISAKVSQRRRFLGPFFKRDTFSLFDDKNAIETEALIKDFYQCSLNEFSQRLKSNNQL